MSEANEIIEDNKFTLLFSKINIYNYIYIYIHEYIPISVRFLLTFPNTVKSVEANEEAKIGKESQTFDYFVSFFLFFS